MISMVKLVTHSRRYACLPAFLPSCLPSCLPASSNYKPLTPVEVAAHMLGCTCAELKTMLRDDMQRLTASGAAPWCRTGEQQQRQQGEHLDDDAQVRARLCVRQHSTRVCTPVHVCTRHGGGGRYAVQWVGGQGCLGIR